MGKYDSEAKAKLGEEVWTLLLEQVVGGGIGVQTIEDIATALGRKVLGPHLGRMELAGRRVNLEAEVRSVLSDWWNNEMHDMDQSEALEKLVVIFESASIDMKPLVKQLKKCLDKINDNTPIHPTPEGTRTKSPGDDTQNLQGTTGEMDKVINEIRKKVQ